MDNLIVKYQLIFLTFVIAIASTVVLGIANTRQFAKTFEPSLVGQKTLRPLSDYYSYRLALAESNNQSILETIIDPKKNDIPASAEYASSIPVLVYHGITEDADQHNITLEQFKAQLYALKNAGYNTISLEDYTQFLLGEKRLPEKSFLLTFDDGRKDSVYPTDPILKALNYQATIFVISDQLSEGHPFHLSKSELLSLKQTGRWTFGSHSKKAHQLVPIDANGTLGHFYSNKLWLKDLNRLETTDEFKLRVQSDLSSAKKDLEQAGLTADSFAFPFGDFGQFSQNFPEAEEIVPYLASDVYNNNFYQIYKAGNTSLTMQNSFNSKAAFSKRFEIKEQTTEHDLLSFLSGSKEKTLPYNEPLNNPGSWQNSWGSVSLEDGSLLISASGKTTGGAAFLVGAQNWRNYQASANIQWLTGNTFSFHARTLNSSNYLTCDFSEAQVRVTQTIDGVSETLNLQKIEKPFDPAGAEFTVKVLGNNISCFINNVEVAASDNVNPSLGNGSIGFSTWDRSNDNSSILINNLTVSEVQLDNEVQTKVSSKVSKN